MIAKRIIPLFLLKGSRLCKGTNFQDFLDVGDPVSQGMVFDAQGADEIVIVDIDASKEGRLINTKIINEMINKCRIPISAGGGIRDIEGGSKCFAAGADKIIVNTQAALNPGLIRELADEFGSQSVGVSIDVKNNLRGGFDVYIYSGSKKADVDFITFLKQIVDNGAGEVMLTSIDKEGSLSGFDYGLYELARRLLPMPLIASGGAGCYDDIVKIFKQTDCDASGIGKMLFLRDYDIVRIKSYLKGKKILIREV
jgi:cyclase